MGRRATSACPHSSHHPPQPSDYATPFERLGGVPYEVTYDDRAVIVNGERQLLISGCIHYPRFAEAEWAHQFNLSRQAGLNAVQTYVFWNWHEAEKRQYDWTSEGHNLGRFIELAAEYGLFVYLRVGPFVCSEWTVSRASHPHLHSSQGSPPSPLVHLSFCHSTAAFRCGFARTNRWCTAPTTRRGSQQPPYIAALLCLAADRSSLTLLPLYAQV